ncbi:mannose-1-phosphate guanylyltransferase/mannose-6-phosphate isomerase [Psittacicella hinzii]|uniref:mannose-1-phosphate guanylyltransferase n=1 Tax=Psittacicella hinzii TaxID=2028575 RepID=A0A3A1Y3V5_9GAMM|nr:mannose-1-phosphate guanylyltransferase/mannose-6-phosphate isomerase [Psittacicella hinzii]RIY32131.1 mannose-1-phosphate guanylyltransferase/mannose-6-phosphate isomerase [Psittacicella hinzii]
MQNIYPLVLAGGSGTRLWPISRTQFPKQFQVLQGEYSLMQNTLLRVKDFVLNKPLVVCNEEHRFIVAEQLRQLDLLENNIILEPCSRNTAPAIALGAFKALEYNDEAVLLVLPADHVIKEKEVFQQTVQQALPVVGQGYLATFGIKPTAVETGYGYIKKGQALDQHSFTIEQFVEKPNFATASQYCAQEEYLWNSGIFMFKASVYLDELKKWAPEIYQRSYLAFQANKSDLDFIRVNAQVYLTCPDISVDYAVLEKTDRAVVLPMQVQWSDIGSWQALWEVSEKDAEGNVFVGQHLTLESKNNIILADDALVTTIGVEDLVIVQTRDAVFVAPKERSQEVKSLVDQLKTRCQQVTEKHRQVYRPWGSILSLDYGSRFKVKRITIYPQHKVATQSHYHRAEHWIITQGTAKVYLDDQEKIYTENESIYIPIGCKHSIANVGKMDLHLVEVQTGSYLGDDDVQRYEEEQYT